MPGGARCPSGVGDPQEVNYRDFLLCLQSVTDVQVGEYLDQWILHNAQIDLSIEDVHVWDRDGCCQAELEILFDADRDYELYTSLGYVTASQEDMVTLDLHLTHRGVHKVAFESDARPLLVQIDPACRVTQVNLDNNTWEAEHEKDDSPWQAYGSLVCLDVLPPP
jgi:hypothetical protein